VRAPGFAALTLGAVIALSGALGVSSPSEAAVLDDPVTATASTSPPAVDPAPSAAATATTSTTDTDTSGPTESPAPDFPEPSPAQPGSSTTPPAYVLVLWAAPFHLAPKFPQKLVASMETGSRDIHQLDSHMTGCGTTYQADLYANDEKTADLISSAILHDGDESFPGGSWGEDLSEVVTTADCVPTPPPAATTPTETPSATPAPAATSVPVRFRVQLRTLAIWNFTVTGIDLGNVHPGDHFTVTGSQLPPGSLVSGELHSKAVALGVAVVGADGTFSLPVSVPSDFAPGPHELIMTLTAPGVDPISSVQDITVVPGTPPLAVPNASSGSAPDVSGGSEAAGGGRVRTGEVLVTSNILTHGLNSIADVISHPQKVPAALEIGLVLLIFAILPGHLLNATLAEQYERLSARRPRRPAPGWWTRLVALLHRAPVLGGLALTTITALLFAFADPRFGLTLVSLRLFLGLAIALAVVTYLTNVTVGRIMRARWNVEISVSLRPLGLILTVVGVVVSRVLDFSPGFLVGLVLGLVISEKSLSKHARRAVLLRTSILLGLALLAWLGFSLFDSSNEGGTFASELAVETLVAITTEAVVGLMVELLPLRLLEGEKLFERSKLVWGALYLLAVFIFVVAVVPWEGNWATLGSSLWAWIGIVVGFGVVATGIYLFFRIRTHEEPPELDQDELVSVGSEPE
jgi:hypothetical protein